MATLENIRKRGKLLAVVIGFALAAFILSDFIGKQTSGGSSTPDIAEIDGNTITILDFRKHMNAYSAFSKFAIQATSISAEQNKAIQNEVWEMIIRTNLLNDSYSDNGIDVSDKEVAALVRGEGGNYSQLVKQIPIFMNQKREFDPQNVQNFFDKYMDESPEAKQFGLYLEYLIRENRKYEKYTDLISKGLNVSSAEANMLYKERVHVIDIKYVAKKFNKIKDSTIKVKSEEIKDYYIAHKKEYKQEHTRDIAYVTFDIVPSPEDIKVIKGEIESLKKEFSEINIDTTSADVITYVKANSENPYRETHYKKGDFRNKNIDSLMFDSELGFTYGTYKENGYFKLIRLIEKIELPDSVEARHILIQPDGQNIVDMKRANEIADSLKNEIEGGADFSELAKTHSADTESGKKGGKLDKFTEGRMIKSFSDACFYGKKGELKIVETNYGVHIVEVLWQSKKIEKVAAAIIEKKIVPGEKTISKAYQKAGKFASENNDLTKFENSVVNNKLTKKIVTSLTPTTETIAGLEDSRSIITWTFGEDREKGDVSEKIFQTGDRFIVAAITKIKEKGFATLEDKKNEIEREVRKIKKGKILADEMKKIDDKNFKNIASDMNGETGEAKNISFLSSRIPKIGNAKITIATALSLEKNKKSEPIIDETGVFKVKVTSITGVKEVDAKMVENDKKNTEQRLRFRANREAYQALKDAAKIEDNRHKFF